MWVQFDQGAYPAAVWWFGDRIELDKPPDGQHRHATALGAEREEGTLLTAPNGCSNILCSMLDVTSDIPIVQLITGQTDTQSRAGR